MTFYMVSYILPPDKLVTGVHNHVHNLYLELKKRKIKTKIVTASDIENPDIKRINTCIFVKVPVFNFLGVLLFSTFAGIYIISKSKKENIKIVHTHGSGVHLSGVLGKFLLRDKIKFVMTQHITEMGKMRIGDKSLEVRAYSLIEKLGYKFSDKVICVSELIREECLRDGCKKEKLTIIPNAIPAKKPRMTPYKNFYLFSGSNFRRKGTKELLQAYRIYKNLGGKLPIKMTGRMNEELKDDGIFQLGWISEREKNRLFSNCFALLHPAIYDPCPTVVFEAMVYGKPVICFNTGGHADIVKRCKNGIICENLSEKSMAEAMIQLEKNKNLYKRMSKNSVESIKNFFWNKVVGSIIGVYKELDLW